MSTQERRAQLDADAAEIDRLLTEAVSTKSYGDLAELERRVTALADARAELERKEACEQDPRYAALRSHGGMLAVSRTSPLRP
jgi:hypothetical protein